MSDVLGSVNGSAPAPARVPTVELVDGQFVVRWPTGRAPQFVITADLFESLIQDLNDGKRAVAALGRIADALRDLRSTGSPVASTST